MSTFIEQNLNQVLCMDALELLVKLPDSSIDLIVVDPPYFKVKKAAWDHQWDTPAKFITWIGTLCEQWRRVLKPNGSLYCFASPQMAARVEVKIGDYFNVLNNIIWYKPSGRADAASKQSQRTFFPSTERIVFAEQHNSDGNAETNTGFYAAEQGLKKRIFGDYLKGEYEQAKVNTKEIAALFPSATGNLTGCVSNWLLGHNMPTAQQYSAMREYLNNKGDYLRREYEDLRREYEDLRREYEDLRREYEDLRRPFSITADVQFTDVWNFFPVQAYPGKHECEKPIPLLKHIIEASSKPGAVVLDCFAGSGATLDAARQLGRNYIGGDVSEHWTKYARHRLELPYTVAFFDSIAKEQSA